MALLSIEDLTVRYPSRHGDTVAIHRVSLDVYPGEILGLVGESGAGKSTIGQAIVSLLPQCAAISNGKITVDGKEIRQADEQKTHQLRGSHIGFIFQDPMTALNPVLSIEEHVELVITQHLKLKGNALRQRAYQLLTQVGVDHPNLRLKQYPHQLSGGLRQRVVIALALAGEPKLLIADEPTTALDVSLQSQILQLIKHLCKKKQVGCLLITHDMGVVSEITDRVAVMHRGKIIDEGETQDVFLRPTHPYTKSLIAAIPRVDVRLARFATFDFTDQPIQPVRLSQSWLKKQPKSDTLPYPLLELKDVTLKFPHKYGHFGYKTKYLHACQQINLQIYAGESLGLVGESGSGKSSLARLIVGLHPPSSGQILFENSLINHAMRSALIVQMIFQNPFASLNPRLSIEHMLGEPIRWYKLANSDQIPRIIDEVLELVGLNSQAAKRYPHEFSGGQRQRLSIARALITRPKFLVCDEPTSALDLSVQAQILNLLRDLQDEFGLTLLFISHDLAVIRQMCDRTAVMKSGSLVELASTELIFSRPKHTYTQQLVAKIPRYETSALDDMSKKSS